MSFKDSKIAAAANSAMTLSAELAVDTEEYTLCTCLLYTSDAADE